MRIDEPEVVASRLIVLQINRKEWSREEVLHILEPCLLVIRENGIDNTEAKTKDTINATCCGEAWTDACRCLNRLVIETSFAKADFVKPNIAPRRGLITVDKVPHPSVCIACSLASIGIVNVVSYTLSWRNRGGINPSARGISLEREWILQDRILNSLTYKSAEPLSKSMVNICGGVPMAMGSK
jgi:hypothetical protein